MPVERLSPSSVVDVDLLGVLGWVTYGLAVSEAANSEGRDLPPWRYLQVGSDMPTVVLPQGHGAWLGDL
jgi:hypothetical protein